MERSQSGIAQYSFDLGLAKTASACYADVTTVL